eukprot:2044232-Amphidinium_carterae.1
MPRGGGPSMEASARTAEKHSTPSGSDCSLLGVSAWPTRSTPTSTCIPCAEELVPSAPGKKVLENLDRLFWDTWSSGIRCSAEQAEGKRLQKERAALRKSPSSGGSAGTSCTALPANRSASAFPVRYVAGSPAASACWGV